MFLRGAWNNKQLFKQIAFIFMLKKSGVKTDHSWRQCDLKTMLWPIRLQQILVAIMLEFSIAIAALQKWNSPGFALHSWKHNGGAIVQQQPCTFDGKAIRIGGRSIVARKERWMGTVWLILVKFTMFTACYEMLSRLYVCIHEWLQSLIWEREALDSVDAVAGEVVQRPVFQ